MKVDGDPYRTIWFDATSQRVEIIDQTRLPHRFEIRPLSTLDDVVEAIVTMRVRGAPLIGAAAAYGLALALRHDPSTASEERACAALLATRPTAVNLRWALERMRKRLVGVAREDRAATALEEAAAICDEDSATCERIGLEGLPLLERAWEKKRRSGEPLNLLTHCNAGWLATVDWGTALAPIYKAHEVGIPVHVWVDETRPRNQGASLTAWELAQHGIDHTVIVDNTGGHLIQRGRVDLCIVGSDRTTAHGDVCNKIGTYLKALAAADNEVPFYVALPISTIDFTIGDGIAEIPIEERDASEVSEISGATSQGEVVTVRLIPAASSAANYAFDVTPARLVTRLITEHGVIEPNPQALEALRREHVS